MEVMEWIRFIIGAIFIVIGLSIFILEVFGVFRFSYALNRMHAAAMGDTLGIGSSILGLMILCGLNIETCKMIIIVMFFWIASPVCSHMLSKLEATTNEHLSDHCTRWDDLSALETELEIEQSQDHCQEETKGGASC